VREFAFQGKFKRRDDVHDKVINRCQQFFFALQQSAYDWLFLGTTKTGLVYRLKGWQILRHGISQIIFCHRHVHSSNAAKAMPALPQMDLCEHAAARKR
jgi:hypothetical protein